MTAAQQPGVDRLGDVLYRLTDLEVVEGAGCWVTTGDGRRLLDFTAGIAVASTGHCHPHVVEAIRRQAGRIIHAQVNCYRHDLLGPLSEALDRITPAPISHFFFANSGAEAVEAAVKFAKQHTKRPKVIAFRGGFHGRTHLAMALTTSKAAARAGYEPLPSGVSVTPFPAGDDEVARCLAELDLVLATQSRPDETAAIIVEPVLGEGGYLPAPAAFLAGLRAVCDEHGILLVLDEVQSGFGRTGELFACELLGVKPDLLVLGKGMASGFPMSAVGMSTSVMASSPTGAHGGTYGGNPLGCAAALATIDVLTAPGFLRGVRARGERLRAGLRAVAANAPTVVDVRGPGLMVGVELATSDASAEVRARCLTDGDLLLMDCGPGGRTLRFMPPLVVDDAEIDHAIAAFRSSVN